jgi:hypothetical protein
MNYVIINFQILHLLHKHILATFTAISCYHIYDTFSLSNCYNIKFPFQISNYLSVE